MYFVPCGGKSPACVCERERFDLSYHHYMLLVSNHILFFPKQHFADGDFLNPFTLGGQYIRR